MTEPEILSRHDDFIGHVIDRLGTAANDFRDTMDVITQQGRSGESWRGAGVLLPLFFRRKDGRGEFVFKLMKRSTSVVQGGDISCPGGMLHPFADPLLRPLIEAGIPPILREKPLAYAKQRGQANFRIISLFLANAIREAWEELRISPFNVRFLGPLPARPLIAFTRIIFPLVGYIRRDWSPKPNWEVDKILELPLKNFFNEENYGLYTIETSYNLRDNISGLRHFPCFIAKDEMGKEEILWGATFSIVMSFFKIVFNFEIPDLNGNRTFKKILAAEYLTGNQKQ